MTDGTEPKETKDIGRRRGRRAPKAPAKELTPPLAQGDDPRRPPTWTGNPQLEQFLVPLESLKVAGDNARRHTPRSIGGIKSALAEFGQQTPIVVDRDGVVRKGNGTIEAAMALGWSHLSALVTDLDDAGRIRLYAIADNRTSELSAWDTETLAGELQAQFRELDESVWLSWWKDYELQPLMEADLYRPKGATGEDDLFSKATAADPIKVTGEQRLTIDRAIAQLKAREGAPDIKEGRAIELICAEWLS